MDNDWGRFILQAKKASSAGNYAYAETIWTAALQEAEDFGESDERLVQTLEGLADAYTKQGKYRHAEKPGRQILEISTRLYGNEDLRVANSAHNLAGIFHMQQKFGQAEPLYKMALSLKTKLLGAGHGDVIRLLQAYSDLLQKTHREAEAENLLRCAQLPAGTARAEGRPGENLPAAGQPAMAAGSSQPALNTSASMSGLKPPPLPPTMPHYAPPAPPQMRAAGPANAPNNQTSTTGPQQVVPTVQQSGSQSAGSMTGTQVSANYGQQSPILASSYNQSTGANEATLDLSPVSQTAGEAPPPQYAPGSPERLALAEKTWSEFQIAAEAALSAGKAERSLELWFQAISVAEEFPARDSRLARSLDRAGEILSRLEKYGQAEMVWGRSLQIKRSILGTYHPAVAFTANHLAGLHYLMGRYSEAEFYAMKCLEIYRHCNGAQHPNVALCLHNLACLYHVQGRYKEAEQNYRASLDIRKKVLGAEHPDTKSVTKSFADLLKTLGRDEEANELNSAASGFLTGSWKAIAIPVDQSLSLRDDSCSKCGADMKGQLKCPSCKTTRGASKR
ncbi:MAG TPA: tetratricopeptide repeat protein [Candidatus Obscuribacter sp.]|nr:tetratricopeptide repeat protein [Candidatus Obscuribacter sp.]HNB15654.1 tetratricopeptide repeat protein [Candidatus Obscuribacter sp.]